MSFNPHEAIEMEERHIREGKARVAQQEKLVIRLDLLGTSELAVLANELLFEFRDFVAAGEKRLAELRRCYPDKPSVLN